MAQRYNDTVHVDARGPVARIEYIAEGHQIKMEVR